MQWEFKKNLIGKGITKHIEKFGEHEPVFADWYSGTLIVAINEETHSCYHDLYIFTTYREITIKNGDVILQNEFKLVIKSFLFSVSL